MNHPNQQTFNIILKTERKRRGWSQKYVAEYIGAADFNTVSRWERGIGTPTPYFRPKLCELFGKSLQELGLFSESSPSYIFLSYAPTDEHFAERVKRDLEKHNFLICNMWDRVYPPIDREKWLRTALNEALTVVLLASPQAARDPSIREELALASMYECSVQILWIEGSRRKEVIPPLQATIRAIDAIDARSEHYEEAIHGLVATLQKLVSLPKKGRELVLEIPPPRNPYKGLLPFRFEDARDFFGRDQLIDTLTDEVEQVITPTTYTPQPVRLLTVIGPSGSGKSSLILAGLLPRLRLGELPSSSQWVYLSTMTPGKHPLEVLTRTLGNHFQQRSLLSLREDLVDECGRGLHNLATQLISSPDAKVILVVDQIEELFTQTMDEWERRQFIKLLVTAGAEPGGPLLILLTLRADFYERPMYYPELGEIITQQNKSVFSMNRQELRAAIEQPALLSDVQLTFEEGLVEELLNDVQGQMGALPLLQFTLEQLFLQRQGRQLTFHVYHAIGGVKGALLKQAEDVYKALPSEEHRWLARALFVRLIEPGATEQDATRRRAMLSEFALGDLVLTDLMQETMESFITARLLTTGEVASLITVEVSHEALIREWPRFTDWLHESREDIRLQKNISEDAIVWKRGGKPRDQLYRGTKLIEAHAWMKRNTPSRDEQEFLQAGRKHEREGRLQRKVLVSTALVMLVTLLIGTLVFQNYRLHSLPVSVTNLNDSGPGSLRAAIADAGDGSAITFDKSLKGIITLSSGPLEISKNITISGPGASSLAISGSNRSTVFAVDPYSTVTIGNLTIEHGYGGIYNDGSLLLVNSTISDNTSEEGAGVYNDFGGKLTILNSIIFGNKSGKNISDVTSASKSVFNNMIGTFSTMSNSTLPTGGGNICKLCGGGIYSLGSLSITGSTIYKNMAEMDGGGIFSFGPFVLLNSTITENKSGENGGGMGIVTPVYEPTNAQIQAFIRFSTIYGNLAKMGGGFDATGVETETAVQVDSSIVAGNKADRSPDISGSVNAVFNSLIQSISGTHMLLTESVKHSSIFGVDPKLGPLQNNGGSTPTLALLPDSPAIDRLAPDACIMGDSANFINTTQCIPDQRGVVRPQGKGCDIGAYEYVDGTKGV